MRGSHLRWLGFLFILTTLAAGLLSRSATTLAADVSGGNDSVLTVNLQSVGGCPTGWWVAEYSKIPYYFYVQDGYTQFKDGAFDGPDLPCSAFSAPMRVEMRVPSPSATELPATPTTAPGGRTPSRAFKAHIVTRLAPPNTPTPVSTIRDFIGQLTSAWTLDGIVTFNIPTGSFAVRVRACTTDTSNCTRVDGPTPSGTGAYANVRAHSTSSGEWFADSVDFQPPPPDQAGFSGVIQQVPPAPFVGLWSIGGRSVIVTAETVLPSDRSLIVPQNIATVQADIRGGVFVARRIDITAPTLPEDSITLQGVVTDADGEHWTVGCVPVTVLPAVAAAPSTGTIVTITISRRADTNTLQASRVTVNPPGSFPVDLSVILKGPVERRTSATRIVVAGQNVESTTLLPPMILPESIVEVRARCDGTTLKGSVALSSQATRFDDINGVIQAMFSLAPADNAALWTLRLVDSGTLVDVRVSNDSRQTRFIGLPRSWATVGARVSVSGVPSTDGTRILADRVEIVEPAHATLTPTSTPSPSPSATLTPTLTPPPTETPTATQSPSETPTATVAPTETPTPSDTATPTDTPAATVTDTPTPFDTPTATETAAPTETPTVTPTETATPADTATPAETPSDTATPTETPTETPVNAGGVTLPATVMR